MERKFKNLRLTFLIVATSILLTGCDLYSNLLTLSFFKISGTSIKSELSDERFNGTFTKNYEGQNYNCYSASYDYYKVVEETYVFDGSNKVKVQIAKRLYRLNEENEEERPDENHYVRTVNSLRYQEFQIENNDKYRVREWNSRCKPADFCDWLNYEFFDNNNTLHLYITDNENPLLTNYEEYIKVN